MNPSSEPEGILPVDKPRGKTSFSLVAAARRIYKVRKIGHAGTLDPFATGVMILLVGRRYTRLSDAFLQKNKEYTATLRLGIRTDSYDCDGTPLSESDLVPSKELVDEVLSKFQGTLLQVPPMFSAKKVGGKKLYELARKGIEVKRAPCEVLVAVTLTEYSYPFLTVHVACSKGTYIRSLAEEIGSALGCGAHLCELRRTASGPYGLDACIDGSLLFGENPFTPPLIQDSSFQT